MKLSEAMKEKMLLSFEVFPPKTEKGMENLPETIEHLMKYKPEYISCTYGAGGGNVGANRYKAARLVERRLVRLVEDDRLLGLLRGHGGRLVGYLRHH